MARQAKRDPARERIRRSLDDPTLAGRVLYVDGEGDLGRVDQATLESLHRHQLDHEQDPTAVMPLHRAVSALKVNAVMRAGVHLAAPPWPGWLVLAIDDLLFDLISNEDRHRRPGRKGRHAKELTRIVSDRRDFERAQAVRLARERGLSWRAAYRAASRALTGTAAAGSAKVMAQAYQRVAARWPITPSRYRP